MTLSGAATTRSSRWTGRLRAALPAIGPVAIPLPCSAHGKQHIMTHARAIVATSSGSRYLQQLCKHWGHKFEVSSTPVHGEIALPLGACRLDADATTLDVRLSSTKAEDLPRFRQVVEEHIQRFAFRETLVFNWTEDRGASDVAG